MRIAAGGELHDATDTIAIGLRADQLDAQAAICCGSALRFVAEQVHRAPIGRQQQIQLAVIVDVRIRRATPHTGGRKRRVHRFRHFFEFPFAHIAEKMHSLRIADIGLHFLNVVIDVAVGDENVLPAVEVVVKKEAAESQCQQGRAANFRARRFINKKTLAFVVIERNHLVREIGDEHTGVAGMVVVGGVHAHAGARHTVFAESHSRNDRLLAEGAVAIVAIEFVRLRVVREQQIRPAVIVVIENGHAQRFRSRVTQAGFLRHVLKRAVSPVVPKSHGRAFVRFRRAIGFTLSIQRAVEVCFGRPLHIVCDY